MQTVKKFANEISKGILINLENNNSYLYQFLTMNI